MSAITMPRARHWRRPRVLLYIVMSALAIFYLLPVYLL
jgi:hypothetical protein